MYSGMKPVLVSSSGIVQLPQLDRDLIEWNCARHWEEFDVIGHSGTRVSRTFVELDGCVRNVSY